MVIDMKQWTEWKGNFLNTAEALMTFIKSNYEEHKAGSVSLFTNGKSFVAIVGQLLYWGTRDGINRIIKIEGEKMYSAVNYTDADIKFFNQIVSLFR